MEIRISLDLLRAMLRGSYEAGWYGSIELGDEHVEEMIRKNEVHFVRLKPTGTTGLGHLDGAAVYGPAEDTFRPQPPLTMADHPVMEGSFRIGVEHNIQPQQWVFNAPPSTIHITTQEGHDLVMQDLPMTQSEFTIPYQPVNVQLDPETWRNSGDG